jgi:hypothetical protein
MSRWLLLTLLVSKAVLSQSFDVKSGGQRPPEPEVLALIQSYTQHLMGWTTIADRDRQRRPLVAPDYFYHDLNGSDIGFDGLTERHKRNDLRISEGRIYDAILYQHDHSAILTYKSWTRGMDKGRPFEGYGSAALVMTKTTQGWRVAADIMGQDPPVPTLAHAPAATATPRK